MKLADKLCYPLEYEQHDYKGYPYKALENGLNFRERLIIALASNMGSIVTVKDYHKSNAIGIIQQADAIIKEMEK